MFSSPPPLPFPSPGAPPLRPRWGLPSPRPPLRPEGPRPQTPDGLDGADRGCTVSPVSAGSASQPPSSWCRAARLPAPSCVSEPNRRRREIPPSG
ncbi:hypothetical protein CLM62_05935 [Streptomyces sp. SA15]|nr:hypothetical protein CLM62_05935 [Streptomyces sp. SA15]